MTPDRTTAKSGVEPLNVFENTETIEAWDEDYYHPVALRYYDQAIGDMLAMLQAHPDDVVLDAGCGPGVHSIRAARRGCRVVAIDFSAHMLSEAAARAEAAGVHERIEFRREDLTRLSLEAGSFRHVFSWGVVIHIPEAAAALERLANVLAPGGRLALQVTNDSALDLSLERLVRRLLGRPVLPYEATPLGPGLWYEFNDEKLWLRRFNAAALEREMARHGLRLVDRRAAEYTELQWRLGGVLRTALLHFNRLAYRFRFPVRFSCTQIMVFEKPVEQIGTEAKRS